MWTQTPFFLVWSWAGPPVHSGPDADPELCIKSLKHLHPWPYVLHITSPLWNAMGNSWGNSPLNINDRVERSGFSYCFFPLVSMVTAALRDFPQEMNQREKERTEREKGQRRVRKRPEGCMGVQYFLLRGQSLVSYSASRVLIHRSQGVNTNLYTACHYFCSFSTLLSLVLSAGEEGFLRPATRM